MSSDLMPLLNPQSVAIIGVSNNPTRIGGRLFKYITKHGYRGTIYPVNPKYTELSGLACYPTLSAISTPIDCALIAVPEKDVISVVHECADHQVRSAILFSSGYAEMGQEGRQKQQQLAELAKSKKMRLCGPNCIGIINFHDHVALSFSQLLEIDKLLPGRIGFISQSGALGGSLVNRAQDMNIGLSYFISCGNEADVEISEYIKYLVLHDEKTQVIAALIEGFKNGPKFLEAANLALEHGKPLIVLKVGETETGRKAAASHTGSLTGSDAVIDAVLKQNGVIRVRQYDELLPTAMLFARGRVPKGKKVGILTSSGGGGIIMADNYTRLGFSLPEPSPATKSLAAKEISSFGHVDNPFDLTGQIFSDPEMFRRCMRLFVEDDNFDLIQVNVSMVAGKASEDRSKYLLEAVAGCSKPVVTWWAAGSLSEPGIKLLMGSDIAVFKSPERCAQVVKYLADYHEFLESRAKKSTRSRHAD